MESLIATLWQWKHEWFLAMMAYLYWFITAPCQMASLCSAQVPNVVCGVA